MGGVGVFTVESRRLDDAQALLELCLGGGQLRVRGREVFDLLVELLLDGAQLLRREAVETYCARGVSVSA